MFEIALLDGFIYAIQTEPMWFEPHLAVETDDGFLFVHADVIELPIGNDGPHAISQELRRIAPEICSKVSTVQVFSIWSERLSSENLERVALEDILGSMMVLPEDKLFVGETIQQRLSGWLHSSRDWAGSTALVQYGPEGMFTGAFVNLYTANPYKLMVLLRWLGVPPEIVNGVTGLDRPHR